MKDEGLVHTGCVLRFIPVDLGGDATQDTPIHVTKYVHF